jgi:hypothetical protein
MAIQTPLFISTGWTTDGNIQGANLTLTGSLLNMSSGNITVANVNTGNISASGNIVSGNVITTIISAQGNITSANLYTGNLTTTGNITSSANLAITANITSGNLTTGNLRATSNVIVTGNIILLNPTQTGSDPRSVVSKGYVDTMSIVYGL